MVNYDSKLFNMVQLCSNQNDSVSATITVRVGSKTKKNILKLFNFMGQSYKRTCSQNPSTL